MDFRVPEAESKGFIVGREERIRRKREKRDGGEEVVEGMVEETRSRYSGSSRAGVVRWIDNDNGDGE